SIRLHVQILLVCLLVSQPVSLSLSLSLSLSIYLFVYLSLYLSIYLYISLSIYIYACLPAGCLSFLSLFLPPSFFPFSGHMVVIPPRQGLPGAGAGSYPSSRPRVAAA